MGPAPSATRGIALMLAGTLLLTTQDAVSKWLRDDFTAGEILFYRGLFAYLPLALLCLNEGGVRALVSARPWANALRAACNTGAGLLIVTAYAFMPLADAMAIMFASPILVTALSVPLLAEPVGWRRWLAVLVGFGGVVVMLRPGAGVVDTAALLALGGAVAVALRDVLTRKLGSVDGPTTILFYTITMTVIGGLAAMAVTGARWPDPEDWAVFFVMGWVNGFSHWLVIRAFFHAPAVTLVPLRYLGLVWAALIGLAVWGEAPGPATLAGTALVVLSGLYIFAREQRLARR